MKLIHFLQNNKNFKLKYHARDYTKKNNLVNLRKRTIAQLLSTKKYIVLANTMQ